MSDKKANINLVCGHPHISMKLNKYTCDTCGATITVMAAPTTLQTFHNVTVKGTL